MPALPARVLATMLPWLLLLPLAAVAAEKETRPDLRPKVGEFPPDLFGTDREGEPVRLADLRGKVVVVTFWASWCGPCRRELPMLGHVQKTVGREHLEVIAVNVKEPRRDYLGVIRANRGLGLRWVHDPRGAISDAYGVRSLPNMFILDQDGTVAYRHIGYGEETLQVFVEEILGLLPPEVTSRPAGGS